MLPHLLDSLLSQARAVSFSSWRSSHCRCMSPREASVLAEAGMKCCAATHQQKIGRLAKMAHMRARGRSNIRLWESRCVSQPTKLQRASVVCDVASNQTENNSSGTLALKTSLEGLDHTLQLQSDRQQGAVTATKTVAKACPNSIHRRRCGPMSVCQYHILRINKQH